MARGKPALLSSIVGVPFVGGGAGIYLGELVIPGASGESIPPVESRFVGLLLVAFGGFVILTGLYVQLVTTTPPSLRSDEKLIATQQPAQRMALLKICTGVPMLAVAFYLFFLSRMPYVYPTIALLAGLFLFSSGLKSYWVNTLTTYFVTTQRVISEYRFVSLRRKEIPLEKIRAVEERKSAAGTLVGLGNVLVASGGGGGSVRLAIRQIPHSIEVADEIREQMNDISA